MNKIELREDKMHGTTDFPFHIIPHIDKTGDYYVPMHWHPEIEIVYIEKGDVEVYCGEEKFFLTQGEFIIINSNELHYIQGVTKSLHHAIIFHPRFLDFNYFDLAQEKYIQPITSGKFQFRRKVYEDKGFIGVVSLLTNQKKDEFLMTKVLIYTLINEVYKRDGITVEVDQTRFEKIKEIIWYIQKNYNEKIKLEELCQKVGYSKSYLCKFFKKNMGITIFEYINHYRIYQSLHLLKGTDKTILEVAFEVGFEDESYFIKKFKQEMNDTPNNYRKMQKINKAFIRNIK
ncbi:AraC family transcriptional regulator [Macrococcus animalis]|uniref:AraC family transcriptional regulator n=1 Tax=Macrococcus animalis TaxID=3395467 RepID=UPI0039BDA4D2